MRQDMRICGSCYTLVVQPDNDGKKCPRCGKDLDPSPESRLEKFVSHGIDTSRQGIPLQDAQEAAQLVLDALRYSQLKLSRHHQDGACTECGEHLEGYH